MPRRTRTSGWEAGSTAVQEVGFTLANGIAYVQAAIEAASQPAIPLLGATVVAIMAFYPIFLSTEGAGEYCRTLFTVVAMSLLTSWVISMTVTLAS